MISGDNWVVHFGSCLDVLPTLPHNSVDSIVTDPPYELGFMGKKWDSSGIAFNSDVWVECLRVLKPGGHLLAFGGSRTWHRIAVAIEDAGFEVRDSIAWLYGSGFPKSLDISKAIDKAAGAEREVIGEQIAGIAPGTGNYVGGPRVVVPLVGEAVTDEAKQWQGWGTALKPAFEPIVVARKPLIGTVAANVLEWGVGGLNIDGSRIRMSDIDAAKSVNNWKPQGYESKENIYEIGTKVIATEQSTQGRWPANVILDEYTAPLVDEQSGVSVSKSGGMAGRETATVYGKHKSTPRAGHDDSGGASRFFYVAKANKRDRNEGLEELPEQRHTKNFHPTVKPTTLMRYLVKLVTPPGGTVLDPFTGSGSTGKAAILEGFQFIGVELTEDYLPIIEGRLNHAVEQINEVLF